VGNVIEAMNQLVEAMYKLQGEVDSPVHARELDAMRIKMVGMLEEMK